MNDLPHFQPYSPMETQLSSLRLNKIVLGQTSGEIRPGFGVMSSRTPGGTTLSVKRQRKASAPNFNLFVSDPFQSGTGWAVTVTAGYLEYQQLGKQDSDGGPLFYLIPTISGTAIEDPNVPEITFSSAGFIYMHCTTDNSGVPNMTPTIQFYSDQQDSTHHVPESAGDGEAVDGDYYWLLAKIEEVPDSDPVSYTIKRRISGNKFLPNQLVHLKNIGGEVEIYNKFNTEENLHELRTLANVSDGSGVGVLRDDEDPVGDIVHFRKIDAKSDSPLQVSLEGQLIQIAGNGYAGPGSGIVKNLISQDGLVTAWEIATGWWGTVTFQDGGGNNVGRLTFQDGVLALVENAGSGGGWATVPGTQASPGNLGLVVN